VRDSVGATVLDGHPLAAAFQSQERPT